MGSYRFAANAIKSAAKALNVGITKRETLERLRLLEHGQRDIEFLQALFPSGTSASAIENLHKSLHCLPKSLAQYRQDIFALSRRDFETNGYFVEFGATNGIELSNTHLLEKEFGWSGILAEPARSWHKTLYANRTAIIDTSCVWRDSSSQLPFDEVEHAGLSTISEFSDLDLHRNSRTDRKQYVVQSISLLDLLDKHAAPPVIDFLSIDTEGSEFEILSHFDFSKYQFRTITCEHNYTPTRELILELLSANGYTRVLTEVSYNDDWYILNES